MRNVTILAAALATVLWTGTADAVGGGGDGGSGGDTELSDAQRAIDAGQYSLAISKLRELLQSDRRNADILNLLGYSYRNLGRYDDSARYYEAALAADPNHIGALEYQGELFILLGDLASAGANLQRLAALCGDCEAYEELDEALAAAGG